MNRPEWIPDYPCPEFCKRNNDIDKAQCKLYAYDLDCSLMSKYQGAIEYQCKLLEHLIVWSNYQSFTPHGKIFANQCESVLKQLINISSLDKK